MLHSPLGASSAERWQACPGSVALVQKVSPVVPTEEPEWTREGLAMHDAGARCLTEGLDTWEIVGETFHNTELTQAMAEAVQVYLDFVRPIKDVCGEVFVERHISSPVHPQFYGTCDFGGLELTNHIVAAVHIADFKGGVGITVEADDNPQMKYYAFGLVDAWERGSQETLDSDTPVHIAIVQPRAFHSLGPIRTWETSVGELKGWVHDQLVPAMERTSWDSTLTPGDWCRFCPAKLVCPVLRGVARAAAIADASETSNLTDIQLAAEWQLIKAGKHYFTAVEREALARLNAHRVVGELKLVYKKANRVYRDDADPVAAFGEDAWEPRALKSPAQLEMLGAKAKAWAKEHCYMPVGDLTVAGPDDKRPAVKVQSNTEMFAAALEHLTNNPTAD